jgi:hypothetical protein
MDDLIFPMSLPSSASSSPQVSNPTRRNYLHRDSPSPTDLRSPINDYSPSLGRIYPNTARFSEGSLTSGTQHNMTSMGTEEFRLVRPRHNSIPPQQQETQPPCHVNSRPRLILTASDFSRRHSCWSSRSLYTIRRNVLTLNSAVSSRSSSGSSSKSIRSLRLQDNCCLPLTLQVAADSPALEALHISHLRVIPPSLLSPHLD